MFENLLSMKTLSDNMTSALSGAMGDWYPILYNTIGIISIFLQFMVYQMKDRKRILGLNFVNSIGWMIYFVLQGNFVSGVSCGLGIIRNLVFIFRGKYAWAESRLWLVLFLCISGASAFGIVSWIDVFGLIAGLSSTIAFFMKNEKTIRKISLFTFTAYICNSISHGYVIALIADSTSFISVVIALVRYRNKEEKVEEKEPLTDTVE